jgi:non-specific protein-tyrosine kinase
MTETQEEIDALNANRIELETDLAYQEDLLAEYRNDARTVRQDLEELQLAIVQSMDNVSVVEASEVPEDPIRPRTGFNTILAAAVGMMLGLGVAFLLEYLDDTFRTPEDVDHTLGLSTLGTIGRLPNGDSPLVVREKLGSPVAESFRMLATNIRYSSLDRSLKTLMVTSSEALAGKSFIVANLAVTMAELGLRVVLVDADLRRPQLHRLLDLTAGEGLAEALLEGSVGDRLQSVEGESLQVLVSGELSANPGELVSSQHMQNLLGELAQGADLVLIDSPPVQLVADATVLAPVVDGVLLVLEAGRTRRQAAVRAKEGLHLVGGKLLGVVLNRVPTGGAAQSYYYSGKKEETRQRERITRAWTRLKTAYRKSGDDAW